MDRSDVPLEHTPPSAERTPMESTTEWNFEVRDTCAKCERLAVTYNPAKDEPLCARHATIFMTARRAVDPEAATGTE